MRLEARKYLHDIQQAAVLLEQFTAGKRLADYLGEAMCARPSSASFDHR